LATDFRAQRSPLFTPSILELEDADS